MGNITVYEGNQPYIFISYAHANSPAVLQVLEELSERGYRIWYDSGIEVGSEWPEYIAGHLAGASLMIAFLSNAYMRSDNCRKEMHYALTKKVPVINIFLEETSMTPGMEMQIGNLFALMKYSMPEERFEELSAVEKNIYVLYCFCEDCSVSLSFFFKNNENSFAALIIGALDKIGYKEILPLVQEEMTMFDEDNEDVSIDADKIKVCDEKFQSVFLQGRLHSLTKEYIIKSSDL